MSFLHNHMVLVVSAGAWCVCALVYLVNFVLRHRRLQNQYLRLEKQLGDSLAKGLLLSNKLSASLDFPSCDGSAYEGVTRERYKAYRKEWASWLALYLAAAEIRRQCRERNERYWAQAWWNPSIGELAAANALLSAPEVSVSSRNLSDRIRPYHGDAVTESTVPAIQLGQSIENGLRSSDVSHDLYSAALAKAVQIRTAVREKIATLNELAAQLRQCGISLAPYQEKLTEAERQSEVLQRKTAVDPLGELEQLREAFIRQCDLTLETLRQSLELHAKVELARGCVEVVVNRVSDLRKTPVASAISSLEVAGNYRLDEEDFAVGQKLSQCVEQKINMEESFRDGRLQMADEHRISALEAAEEVKRRLEQALSDKNFVDGFVLSLDSECTTDDLEADQDLRAQIFTSYKNQRWHGAKDACEPLSVKHQERMGARRAAVNLDDRMSELLQEARMHSDATSVELDREIGDLARKVTTLRTTAQQARADWKRVSVQIRVLTDTLLGSSEDSLHSRLQAELSAHAGVLEAVSSARHALSSLQRNIQEGWGGEAASRQLPELAAAVEAAIAEAGIPKQDWVAAGRKLQEVVALLQPVGKLVEGEIAGHQALGSQLDIFEQLLVACEREQYTRTICGITYGAGVYCPTGNARKTLDALRGRFARRDDGGIPAELDAARARLHRHHLECWWLTMLLITESMEPCARRFANSQGLSDWSFDEWAAALLAANSEGFFSLPEVSEAKHPKMPQVQTINSEPVGSDYELAG
jgi:hypothetical protein